MVRIAGLCRSLYYHHVHAVYVCHTRSRSNIGTNDESHSHSFTNKMAKWLLLKRGHNSRKYPLKSISHHRHGKSRFLPLPWYNPVPTTLPAQHSRHIVRVGPYDSNVVMHVRIECSIIKPWWDSGSSQAMLPCDRIASSYMLPIRTTCFDPWCNCRRWWRKAGVLCITRACPEHITEFRSRRY